MTRKRLFYIIQIGNKEDFPSRFFDLFIASTIILNITAMFLETFDQLSIVFPFLKAIEFVTLIIFCIEYALRIWTSDLLYPTVSKSSAVIKFLTSFEGIIDLLTILPFFFLSGFVAFRMLRVVRIFHLFRINSQYDSFNVITTVIKEKLNQIASSVFIILILMLGASLGIYSAEHNAQPEAFPNAFSGMWWAVSCLLTVGYGDIYPITVAGKILAIITAFLGVGVVAIPTGIMSAGFVEHYTKLKHMNTYDDETSLNFVTIHINDSHEWNNAKVSDCHLPTGLRIVCLLRGRDVIIPKNDTVLVIGDTAILAAEAYYDELNLSIYKHTVVEGDPWENTAIRDLDISRLTTIISIKRKNHVLTPHGSTVIKNGDNLIIYSRSNN